MTDSIPSNPQGIQRYEMVERVRGMESWDELQPDPDGDWMLYSDHKAAVEFFQQALGQIYTWIVLHRTGQLSATRAFEEIENDTKRCLPPRATVETTTQHTERK